MKKEFNDIQINVIIFDENIVTDIIYASNLYGDKEVEFDELEEE